MKRDTFFSIDPEQQLTRSFARRPQPFAPSTLTAQQKANVFAWMDAWQSLPANVQRTWHSKTPQEQAALKAMTPAELIRAMTQTPAANAA